MITNWPRKINKSLLMPTMIIHHGIGVMGLRPPNKSSIIDIFVPFP